MKAKKNHIVEDDVFSRGAMKKVLESGNNKNILKGKEKRRYRSFQQGIFIALIVSLLTLFIIRISAAQDSFQKMDRPNLQMDNQRSCSDLLFPPLMEDQKKELGNLRLSYRAETQPIRMELFALKIQLRYLLMDPNVQPGILFENQRKISALHAKLEELSLSYQVKARSVFTKEQLQRLPQGWAFEIGLTYEIPTMDIIRKPRKELP